MNKKKILVYGDPIADVFHSGTTKRISPEAPIPVFDCIATAINPGGAANTAMNLLGCGFDVSFLLSFHPGNDHFTKTILEFMEQCGIHLIYPSSENSLGVPEIDFIQKHRFLDNKNHHVGLRFDKEMSSLNRSKIESLDENIYSSRFWNSVYDYDAIVFSDYDKGCMNKKVIRHIIYLSRRSIMFLDSKSKHLDIYDGVHFFKPNDSEFKYYQSNIDCLFPVILRTKSEDGCELSYLKKNSSAYLNHVVFEDHYMTLTGSSLPESYINGDVIDSTGAGDTVMAALVYYIMNNEYKKKHNLIDFVNCLAYESCRHSGTYVVKNKDIENALIKSKNIHKKRNHPEKEKIFAQIIETLFDD